MEQLKKSHPFYHALLRFFILLVLIQVVRAAITVALWFFLKPDFQSSIWDVINAAGFVITGLALLLVFRPSLESLGLSLKGMRTGQKLTYVAGAILLAALVITTSMFDAGLMLANIVSVFVIPIFEELTFRGSGWDYLRKSDAKASDSSIWMWTAFLFGIWHLGYADVFYLRAAPQFPATGLAVMLLMKVVVGWIYGLITGFVRMRTGKVYAAIWIHGLGNLFGR